MRSLEEYPRTKLFVKCDLCKSKWILNDTEHSIIFCGRCGAVLKEQNRIYKK